MGLVMGLTIDRKNTFSMRQHGDISVAFTWMNDERCMIIIPAYRMKAPWFVVMESAAYTWDDSNNANIPLVARKAAKCCEVLGIEPTPTNCRRIAGIIIDNLPDLIRMPAAPPAEQYKTSPGNLELKANGETVHKEEIKLDKVTGAEYA